MYQDIFGRIDIMYRRLSYVIGGVLFLKTLVLYIYRSKDTMSKQATSPPIIFFLHGIREGYDIVT
jgi:hypothetical protein